MNCSAFDPGLNYRTSSWSLCQDCAHAHNPVWVLEVEQQIAGVLVLQNEETSLLIYSVAIHPTQQKRGYGRLLLAWAEAEAKKAGYQTIRLYTNAKLAETIALYTRLGYQETGREPIGTGVRVNMSKVLP